MNNTGKNYYKLIEEYPNSPQLGTIFVAGFEHFGGELVQPYVKHYNGYVTQLIHQHLETKFFEKSLHMSEDGFPIFHKDTLYYKNPDIITKYDEICSRYYVKNYLIQSNIKYFKIKENCEKYVASLKPILPKSWNDLSVTDGYYVSANSEVKRGKIDTSLNISHQNENVCKTKKQALSQIAFAKLTQLASNMNGVDYEPDWINVDTDTKFVIVRHHNHLIVSSVSYTYSPICFKTAELRDYSLEHHIDLWKQYYQLD
jgi:hypothetical protein